MFSAVCRTRITLVNISKSLLTFSDRPSFNLPHSSEQTQTVKSSTATLCPSHIDICREFSTNTTFPKSTPLQFSVFASGAVGTNKKCVDSKIRTNTSSARNNTHSSHRQPRQIDNDLSRSLLLSQDTSLNFTFFSQTFPLFSSSIHFERNSLQTTQNHIEFTVPFAEPFKTSFSIPSCSPKLVSPTASFNNTGNKTFFVSVFPLTISHNFRAALSPLFFYVFCPAQTEVSPSPQIRLDGSCAFGVTFNELEVGLKGSVRTSDSLVADAAVAGDCCEGIVKLGGNVERIDTMLTAFGEVKEEKRGLAKRASERSKKEVTLKEWHTKSATFEFLKYHWEW
ncbi:hypothetical protein BLNAU_4210 [Blattamonas nauphoetae]|uniref:Uncharacterized protein n=1 Tax=Blattamonas nauphoetae TaxID=2049346 RepID=A0ABQ9YAL1_9EUKA|nr:hypothetical protein BLNAU_4210 [Blattamonas nauphoetae]